MSTSIAPHHAYGSGVIELIQPKGGLFASTTRARAHSCEPGLTTQFVQAGETLADPTGARDCATRTHKPVGGSGVSIEDAEARFLALAECLERYSTSVFNRGQLIWATAEELGSDALDLDRIPRCSSVELAHPKCRLVRPDKKARMRWVRSVSLLEGRVIFVPAVMVYTHAGFASPGERICFPITTGCAGHTSYEKAMISGCLEVVERDAISVLWLQKLPLARIEIDCAPAPLKPYWEQYQRCTQDLEYLFFDATLDLGFPTVYGLQIARCHDRLRTLVSCSTDLNPFAAVTKVIREMASIRVAFANETVVPESVDDFSDILHGAAYMAAAEHASAFDFLVESGRNVRLSEMPRRDSGSLQADLRFVLDRFRERGMSVYAVDLSTDESIRAGVRVVRIVIPELQPLSLHYRGQYLGHKRLYDAPAAAGYRVLAEDQLNTWPQPFA